MTTQPETQDHQIVNGLDITAVKEALATVAAAPGASRAPKTSRVRWLGGFKIKALVRNHEFVVDEPATFTAEDTAPNAMEYVLGALGACFITGFVLNASKQGIAIRNLEVTLDADQNNVFTFFGLSDEGHPGFEHIKAKLYVQADADEATLQAVWDYTIQTSPVVNSLTRVVTIQPEIAVFP
ncbi:MAG: OsmC family protein [Chloroflexi bacterium]|nr:OsmC family protein [Chloroflexota bacterium]